MKGKTKMNWTAILVVAGIIAVAYFGYNQGWFTQQAAVTQPVQPAAPATSGGCQADEATLIAGLRSYVNGTGINTIAAQSLYNNLDTRIIAPTTITAYPNQISTAGPASFDGYILTGNDDNSGIDIYYTKTPVSYGCTGLYRTPTDTQGAIESNVSFQGYDDNSAESIWNITVGTTLVDSASLKITSDSKECIGNPDFDRPIMVCVNGSTSTLAKLNEISVAGVSKSSYNPQVLTDKTSVKGCYILPTQRLCNGESYTFNIRIDPTSDPGITDVVEWCVFDKTYYENDDNVYVPGWEDTSSYVAASDIGLPSWQTACKKMYLN